MYSKRVLLGCTGEPFTAWTSTTSPKNIGAIRCFLYESCAKSVRNRYCEYDNADHRCSRLTLGQLRNDETGAWMCRTTPDGLA